MMDAPATAEDMPHVLVVDDDDRLRNLIAKYLGDNGFLVAPASNAEDARRLMQGLAFDLIVLDLMMPGENGLEFAERLRQKDQTPILMLTAMTESEDRIRGLEKGGDDYLTKPFEPRELVLRIHNILKRARAQSPENREVYFGEAGVFDGARRNEAARSARSFDRS